MSEEVKKTPEEWLATGKYAPIIDPDGWRNTGRSWHDPITREEFEQRHAECTLNMNRRLKKSAD